VTQAWIWSIELLSRAYPRLSSPGDRDESSKNHILPVLVYAKHVEL
jgi:hypothetical protein